MKQSRKENMMKKTEYKVMTNYGITHGATYRRVYEDEKGNRYIRENGEYKCIEGMPCMEYMIKDA